MTSLGEEQEADEPDEEREDWVLTPEQEEKVSRAAFELVETLRAYNLKYREDIASRGEELKVAVSSEEYALLEEELCRDFVELLKGLHKTSGSLLHRHSSSR